MTGLIARVVYLLIWPVVAHVVTWVLLWTVGVDHLAKWLPAVITVYLVPANLILRLILRFQDLARSPDLISRELSALKPAVNRSIRTLWVLEALLVLCVISAGSAPLALQMSSEWATGWVYVGCLGFFVAVYVTSSIPYVFRRLGDFEWDAAERAKKRLEREGYVEKMRQAAAIGFVIDDHIDGSKRLVHGNQ